MNNEERPMQDPYIEDQMSDRGNEVVDAILEMVEAGDISVEVGSKRLETFFDIHYLREIDFDHHALNFWTIDMVISWVKWRDIAQVLRHRALCYRNRSVWQIVSYVGDDCPNGHVLHQYTKPEFSHPYVSPTGETVNLSSFTDEIEEFRNKVSASDSVADGLNFQNGEYVEIKPAVWKLSKFQTIDGETVVLVGNSPKYSNVSFLKKDILEIWEPRVKFGNIRLCSLEELGNIELPNALRPYAKLLIKAYPQGISVDEKGKDKIAAIEAAYEKEFGRKLAASTETMRANIREALNYITIQTSSARVSSVDSELEDSNTEDLIFQALSIRSRTSEEAVKIQKMREMALRRSFGLTDVVDDE